MLLNSILAGGIFIYLGQRNYVNSYKINLSERLENISKAISENSDLFLGNEDTTSYMMGRGMNQGHMRGMHYSSRYIDWMNEVLDSNIWIINKDDNVFQRGNYRNVILYENLSLDEKLVIDRALMGETVTTESFSDIFGSDFISAAAPMTDNSGNIIGAILIHESISTMDNFMTSANYILSISAILGIALASILAVVFANKFIRPLKRLDKIAKDLIQGDYNVKTDIVQDDEIGDLAKNIDELSIRLEKSRIENENLDIMRNDFMSNISHELKTPVTVMKGSLEALVEGVIKDDEISDYHNILYKEVGVLERLVGELMELNSIKNLNFPMNFSQEDLVSILEDASRSQRIIGEEKNVKLELDIKDSYLMINGDYTRLRQMFITVINNAIKFSYEGEKVSIREYQKNSHAIVQIINRGNLIEESEIENMFVSFYRIRGTEEKGFGLGLAIAKEIALRHNITINVKSDMVTGTIFEFVIPIN